jgi:hypothetical protein
MILHQAFFFVALIKGYVPWGMTAQDDEIQRKINWPNEAESNDPTDENGNKKATHFFAHRTPLSFD